MMITLLKYYTLVSPLTRHLIHHSSLSITICILLGIQLVQQAWLAVTGTATIGVVRSPGVGGAVATTGKAGGGILVCGGVVVRG